MAERTSSTITIDASPPDVMSVIADVRAYPDWAGSVREVEVLSTDKEDASRPLAAKFVLDAGAIKDTYTLQYRWDGDVAVQWSLIQAQILTTMEGSYCLSSLDGATTEVQYELLIDLNLPMIGLLRRKAEKVITATALQELKKRVETVSNR